MVDLYGAQSIPITAAVASATTVTVSAADPLLSYLASYLKVAANARLGTEFGALMSPNKAPAAAESPIAFVFEHDPEQFEFVDTKLPALFLFRDAESGGQYEQVAADYRISRETITLLWVLPSGTQDKQASRARFPSKLFHLFDALIERNRDKAWRVNGDADTVAALEGSSLATYGKYWSLKMSRGPKRKPMTIRMKDNSEARVYPAYEALLEVRERLTIDESATDLLDGIDVTLQTPDIGAVDGIVTQDFDLDVV